MVHLVGFIYVMAGLLLAVFPIGVYYSQEIRMYSLLGLLMLSALYAVLLWGRQPRSDICSLIAC